MNTTALGAFLGALVALAYRAGVMRGRAEGWHQAMYRLGVEVVDPAEAFVQDQRQVADLQ